MAWLENVSKHESFAQIPLTQSSNGILFKDITLSFVSDKDTVIRKREISLHGGERTSEVIETIEGRSLPVIASRLMNLEPYQDELNENEFVNSVDLNKTIQILVDKHLDFLRKSTKLLLNKSETATICPDCQQGISIGDISSKLCICYKFMGNNSIHITKNDKGGLTLHFGKKWDQDNIALFSKALKNKLR